MSDDTHAHYEDDWQRFEKRHSRLERKILKTKDRSKYRKSDLDQQRKLSSINPTEPVIQDAKRGRVLSISGELVEVALIPSGEIIPCVLRGALKKERQRLKNLITVGDFVQFTHTEGHEGLIFNVENRKTSLSRADNLSHQAEHVLAANIDLVLITVSVVQPVLRTPIIDRYVIASSKGGMDYLVVVNKIDLLNNEEAAAEKELYEEAKKAYALAEIPFLGVSSTTGQGMAELVHYMQGKACVFSGQSGVGKSSLINTLTGSKLLTRQAVDRTGKGAHTTTKAVLLPLLEGGWVIDTPGIRSFGLWDLRKEEIASYFKEIQRYAPECYFANCTHTHEEHCAVIQAVEEEKIHILRYESYCSLFDQIDEQHLRR